MNSILGSSMSTTLNILKKDSIIWLCIIKVLLQTSLNSYRLTRKVTMIAISFCRPWRNSTKNMTNFCKNTAKKGTQSSPICSRTLRISNWTKAPRNSWKKCEAYTLLKNSRCLTIYATFMIPFQPLSKLDAVLRSFKIFQTSSCKCSRSSAFWALARTTEKRLYTSIVILSRG